MYLMLSVAGHLTIFLARTRGPFWSVRPARVLLAAVLGTQTQATLIAVYGIFMTPLGWHWAAVVWVWQALRSSRSGPRPAAATGRRRDPFAGRHR
jgi:H+-transporting ATPase